MKNVPYVIVSTAISLDGFIDDTSDKRLVFSNEKDWKRVEALRESCDALLVGANTVRKDNPRLVLKSRKKLIKVTITSSGTVDTNSNFLTIGTDEKIVYTISSQVEKLSKKISPHAIVVGSGEKTVDISFVLADLNKRGVKRLLVEGGSEVLTQFLQQGLVDEMQIAIAGFFVGEKDAPRFVNPGVFPKNKKQMRLESVEKLDDMAVLIYSFI